MHQKAKELRRDAIPEAFNQVLAREGRRNMLIKAFKHATMSMLSRNVYPAIAEELGVKIIWGQGGAQTRTKQECLANGLVEGVDFIHINDLLKTCGKSDENAIIKLMTQHNII